MNPERVMLVAWALIAAKLVAQLVLAALNRAEVQRHAAAPPAALASTMDAGTYAKSVAYTLAKNRFGTVSLIFEAGVLALVLGSGILPWLFAHMAAWAPGARWDDALFVVAAASLVSLPSLPFEWWETFELEGRFGFNKSTPRLWVVDRIKGAVLGLLIGLPLVWALLALVDRIGPAWWLWGAGLLILVQLGLVALGPVLFVRMFNKLTPLPEGALRVRLGALAERTGFVARSIEVMDGSKRSGHGNAFFAGLGRLRRVVLYDTLLNQLDETEVEAVLAHEIGHCRRGHIPKRLVTGSAVLVALLAAVGLLAEAGWFVAGFGFPAGEVAPVLLLAGLLADTVLFWLNPLSNRVSRKHEYEADAFAREAMGGPEPLVSALRKLGGNSLANLTPHPLFSAVYYSHPTLVERERALRSP